MTQQMATKHDAWLSSSLYIGKGEDYLASANPTQAAILRGRENWLSRFTKVGGSETSQQAVKEEVQALFARWMRMQNVSILMGAGASYYVTNTLNAGLLDSACKLLKGRRSEKTLAELLKLTTDGTRPARNIEQFLSQLLALSTLFDSDVLPLDRIPAPITLPKAGSETDRELLNELLLDLERAIAVTCNVDLPPSALSSGPSEVVTPHENFLSKLMARDPQDGRAKVFTTNYDTLLEQAMDRLGILYSDGSLELSDADIIRQLMTLTTTIQGKSEKAR